MSFVSLRRTDTRCFFQKHFFDSFPAGSAQLVAFPWEVSEPIENEATIVSFTFGFNLESKMFLQIVKAALPLTRKRP